MAISLPLLRMSPVPVTYNEPFFYSNFFDNKFIEVEIVNGHEFLIHFIFEDSYGKRRYSYIDRSFRNSFGFIESKVYTPDYFPYQLGYAIRSCILAYLEEDELLAFLEDCNCVDKVTNDGVYQYSIFIDNISFLSERSGPNASSRNFNATFYDKNKKGYDAYNYINYTVYSDKVYISKTGTSGTSFPQIFGLLRYTDSVFFSFNKNLINDDFECILKVENSLVFFTYVSGCLSLDSRNIILCNKNRTSDLGEIERVLKHLMFLAIKYKPNHHFLKLLKNIDENMDIKDLTIETLSLIEMYDI